jgi:hypothetical protein
MLSSGLSTRYKAGQVSRILDAMGPVIDGKDSRVADLSQEERMAGLKALVEVDPSLGSDPVRAVETVSRVAETLYTGPMVDLALDYGHASLHASMRRPERVSLGDDVRRHAELLAIEKKAKGIPMGAEEAALQALRIERLHLAGDDAALEGFRRLLPAVGNPSTTLAVERLLSTLDKTDRAVVEARFLEGLENTRRSDAMKDWDESAWVVRAVSNAVLLTSYRRPDEDLARFVDGNTEFWTQVFEVALAEWSTESDASGLVEENGMRAVIEAVCRSREAGETRKAALDAFAGYYAKLDRKTSPLVAARLYMLGQDARSELARVVPTAVDRASSAAAVLELVGWARGHGKAPDEGLPSSMETAMHQSRDRASFERNLAHCLRIFELTGDGATLQKYGDALDGEVAAGRFPAAERGETLETLEAELYRLSALGHSRKGLAEEAWKSVMRLRAGGAPPPGGVKVDDDVVVIGGVKIPRRRSVER